MIDYTKCTIQNICRGKGKRAHLLYAHLVDATGKTVITSTLDYITKILNERIPVNYKEVEYE